MRRRARLFAGLAALVVAGGCGGGANLGGIGAADQVTGYQAASLFSPAGYSVSSGQNGTIRVRAAGTPNTPPERVEKIARARAASYGVEQRKNYFHTVVAGRSILCGKKTSIKRGKTVKRPARGYHVVDLDVAYAQAAETAEFESSRDVAAQLKSELANETVDEAAQVAARAPVAAECGLD